MGSQSGLVGSQGQHPNCGFSLSPPLLVPPTSLFPPQFQPPINSSLVSLQKRSGPSRDINQTQHIKLQKHQAPPFASKVNETIQEEKQGSQSRQKVVQDSSASSQGFHKNTNVINYNFPFCGDKISEQTTGKEEKICFMVSEVSIQLCPTS